MASLVAPVPCRFEVSFPSGPLGIIFVKRGFNLVVKSFSTLPSGKSGPAAGGDVADVHARVEVGDLLVGIDGDKFKDDVQDNEQFKKLMNAIKEAPDHHTRKLEFEKTSAYTVQHLALECYAALGRDGDEDAGQQYHVDLKYSKEGLGLLLRDKTIGDDQLVVFVKKVNPDGQADRSGKVATGDVLTQVNGNSVVGQRLKDVAQILKSGEDQVTLTFKRDILSILEAGAAAYKTARKSTPRPAKSATKVAAPATEQKKAEAPAPVSPRGETKQCKTVTIGDTGVGKTRILALFATDTDIKSPKATVGVEVLQKNVHLESGDTIRLQIWDTAGQERYRAITRSHFRRVHCATIVYDVTRPETLKNAQFWLKELHENGDAKALTVLIVGNKTDLADRQVTKEEGEKFARDNNLLSLDGKPMHMETTALEPWTVRAAFTFLLTEYNNKQKAIALAVNASVGGAESLPTSTVDVGSEAETKKGGCC